MPPREDPKRIGSPSPPPSQDELSFLNLVPAIFVCALVSAASYISCESVELSEDILIAVIRNFVQLSALAALLSPLFRCVGDHHSSRKSPLLVMAYVFFFMLPIAAYEASSRSKFTLHPSNTSSFYNDNLVLLIVLLSRKSLIYPFSSLSFLNNLSICICAVFVAVSSLGSIAIGILRPIPWYSPRHVIPLCGMLLNNALSGTSIALDVVLTELKSHQRSTIELFLSFGLTSTLPLDLRFDMCWPLRLNRRSMR